MSKTGVLSLLSISLCCASLAACAGGGSPPATVAAVTPPATLTGNWSVAGARTPARYPILSTSLFVNGTQITGQMSLALQCLSTPPYYGLGTSSLPISGQIANDGTFQATGSISGNSTTLPTLQVTMNGGSPSAAAPAVWTGSFTVAATFPSGPCTYSDTATFSAVPIPAVSGTYSGAMSSFPFSNGFGANGAISLTISQGAPILVPRGNTSVYQIPLTAAATVTGSSCFTSGATSASLLSSFIGGDSFNLVLGMNDGSQLVLGGNFTDLSESMLSVNAIAIGGNCDNAFAVTTLSR